VWKASRGRLGVSFCWKRMTLCCAGWLAADDDVDGVYLASWVDL
jgi:hypothetical protein